MSIKEQVINEAIERINKRLKAINEIFECRPLNRVIELQKASPKSYWTKTQQSNSEQATTSFLKLRLANEEKAACISM